MEDSTLPARVLDVGSADQPLEPRLYCSGRHSGAYVALSYRWERDYSAKLTMDNLYEYQHHIPYDTLSRVIQDAITITRRLGLRYLWVDSLCIVQDNSTDWVRESRKMKEIYKHSVLTIAVAPTHASSSDGIFSARTAPRIRPVELPLADDLDLFAFQSSQAQLDQPSELDTRAWTLQERLLSPRVALYKSGQLFFECGWHTVFEAQPSKDSQAINPSNPDYWAAIFRMRHTYEQKDDQNRLHIDLWEQCWRGLVENYSARQLTFEKDRMMALFGIVEELKGWNRDAYVVGLWRNRICEHLLWRVKDKTTQYALSGFDGPSWSWLAALHPVTYEGIPNKTSFADKFGLSTNEAIKLTDIEINPDPAFAKAAGKLFLEGSLTKMYQRSDDPDRLYFTAAAQDAGQEDCLAWHIDDSSTAAQTIWLLKVLSNEFGACFLCIVPADHKSEADADANGDWKHFTRRGMCRVVVPNKTEWAKNQKISNTYNDASVLWGSLVKDVDKAAMA